MRVMYQIIIITIMLLVPLMSALANKYSQSSPDNSIDYAIHLLESKQYAKYVQEFFPPSYLAKQTSQKIKELAKTLADTTAEKLLVQLKAAKTDLDGVKYYPSPQSKGHLFLGKYKQGWIIDYQ